MVVVVSFRLTVVKACKICEQLYHVHNKRHIFDLQPVHNLTFGVTFGLKQP